MAGHTYTYLFCDLRTDAVLAELPLRDVRFSTELNGIGTLSATVPYTDDTIPLDPDTATRPARTAVWVDRDGVIVWGGIVWTRELVEGGKAIQAAEFMSYYQRRTVRTTLSTDQSLITNPAYVPDGQWLYADQRYMVWSLLRYAAVQPYGDIGVGISNLAGEPATGIYRVATYFGYERPVIYDAIAALATADDGFDFGVECYWTQPANNNPPARVKRARVWYPRRGRQSAAESGLVFSSGGPEPSILDYDWPENGVEVATDVTALGAGTGEARLNSSAQASDMLTAGYPLLERVTTYSDVLDQTRLDGTARADLAAATQADTQPTFQVVADADPVYGSYQVGDVALVVIAPDERMPTGRRSELRILSIETTVTESGGERITLKCGAV
ncbi:hypothetical protein CG747_20835 [Streptomyces sp. CB02959]|uniref:hypothetical protein n=1 Tax=Streptomyces sp. CB02959 TaxID=2020330 RepID=UPI000C278C91|nr:hypothetical protein [Streptomyces sp. CB02959]PJN38989.1 hypothetical protein CG747_20835 [Streptomyces sp. CB02959]